MMKSAIRMIKSLIHELAMQRKTVRQYLSTPINLQIVTEALATACQAPSGANTQPWRFVVVQDHNMKQQIRAACEQSEQTFYRQVQGDLKKWLKEKQLSWQKEFLEHAPVLLLVFAHKGTPYSLQSVWLAIGYMLLVFEELGVATVPYTPSRTSDVEHVVNTPAMFRLEAIFPIGIANDAKVKEPRVQWRDVTYRDTWDQIWL
jgi:nitroreductase